MNRQREKSSQSTVPSDARRTIVIRKAFAKYLRKAHTRRNWISWLAFGGKLYTRARASFYVIHVPFPLLSISTDNNKFFDVSRVEKENLFCSEDRSESRGWNEPAWVLFLGERSWDTEGFLESCRGNFFSQVLLTPTSSVYVFLSNFRIFGFAPRPIWRRVFLLTESERFISINNCKLPISEHEYNFFKCIYVCKLDDLQVSNRLICQAVTYSEYRKDTGFFRKR